ncbi:hypothetical protein TIFTF001_001794 [Ficus carica]|uniref:Isopenicillin N synthase-like Fe(2+) 2OG dioxygenase domain-containing protein n=1 Tax=Ficus carica TaxID=3494 RepID=A0AA88D5R2_FICCA|nr:hypothetical protein TIFTF001_001794 [Ficus carica]
MVTRMIFDNYGVGKHNCDSHIESMEYVVKFTRYMLGGSNSGGAELQIKEEEEEEEEEEYYIKSKQDGDWITFHGSPSSFIIMASDALQLWSNDRIKPCTHRVVLRGNKVMRYCLLLLTYSKGTLSVPEELMDEEEHPLRFKPLNHPHYVALQFSDRSTRLCLKTFCGL